MMRIMYKVVFSSIELLSVRGYWNLELRAKSKKEAEKTWEKKKSHQTRHFLLVCALHIFSPQTCLEGKLLLHQERARKAPQQVNRKILWADWYFHPCLTFILKTSVEVGLTFSDSGETENSILALIFVKV